MYTRTDVGTLLENFSNEKFSNYSKRTVSLIYCFCSIQVISKNIKEIIENYFYFYISIVLVERMYSTNLIKNLIIYSSSLKFRARS